MRWGPSLAALTVAVAGSLGAADAAAQDLGDDVAPRMSSDRIDPARGLGAHGGGDGLQRTPIRRNRFSTPNACTKECMRETDFEKLKQCSVRCAEVEAKRTASPPGTSLIGAGMLVTVLGAGVFISGIAGLCDANDELGEPDESMGVCGAGMLVGGMAGMVLGPILAMFGLEQGRPDRQVGSSGLTFRF